jgi:hypothetical protein
MLYLEGMRHLKNPVSGANIITVPKC